MSASSVEQCGILGELAFCNAFTALLIPLSQAGLMWFAVANVITVLVPTIIEGIGGEKKQAMNAIPQALLRGLPTPPPPAVD